MNGKDIARLVIFALFTFPFLIILLILTLKSFISPGPENIEEGVGLIVEASIPWWLETIKWLAGLPSLFAFILIVGFIKFLQWIGEIN